MYVYRTGNASFYCSNSCYKNDAVMGRKINRKLISGGIKTVSKRPQKEERKAEKATAAQGAQAKK